MARPWVVSNAVRAGTRRLSPAACCDAPAMSAGKIACGIQRFKQRRGASRDRYQDPAADRKNMKRTHRDEGGIVTAVTDAAAVISWKAPPPQPLLTSGRQAIMNNGLSR